MGLEEGLIRPIGESCPGGRKACRKWKRRSSNGTFETKMHYALSTRFPDSIHYDRTGYQYPASIHTCARGGGVILSRIMRLALAQPSTFISILRIGSRERRMWSCCPVAQIVAQIRFVLVVWLGDSIRLNDINFRETRRIPCAKDSKFTGMPPEPA